MSKLKINLSRSNVYAKKVVSLEIEETAGYQVCIDTPEGRYIHNYVYESHKECVAKTRVMRRTSMLNKGILEIQPQYWSEPQTFDFMALTMASKKQVNYISKLLGIRHDDTQTRAELSMMTNQGASDLIQHLLAVRHN